MKIFRSINKYIYAALKMNLEKEMATKSSSLAWKIQWTEDSGRLWSMELEKSQTQLSN